MKSVDLMGTVQFQPAHNSHPIISNPNQIPPDQIPPDQIQPESNPTQIKSHPSISHPNQFPPDHFPPAQFPPELYINIIFVNKNGLLHNFF